MGKLARQEPRSLLPEILDWMEAPFAGLRQTAGHPLRIEDCIQGDRYVLRAELPGIDPDKDIEVTVKDGILTIHGERQEKETEEHRTEFRYGSFTRSVSLPAGADENDVKAVYDKGVLEISMKLSEKSKKGKRISIEKSKS
ncbi:Hsp20/alpha crystallin family protein [Nonomuraea sp. NPDC048916]|uniref:Hsp20/alpha crystallin family protein n=1 Tax=Nonomuraea sp. NPDC048916 TaxID=3154232 RepID=UPI003404F76B